MTTALIPEMVRGSLRPLREHTASASAEKGAEPNRAMWGLYLIETAAALPHLRALVETMGTGVGAAQGAAGGRRLEASLRDAIAAADEAVDTFAAVHELAHLVVLRDQVTPEFGDELDKARRAAMRVRQYLLAKLDKALGGPRSHADVVAAIEANKQPGDKPESVDDILARLEAGEDL